MDTKDQTSTSKTYKKMTVVIVKKKTFVNFYEKAEALAYFLDDVNAPNDNKKRTLSKFVKKFKEFKKFFNEPCVLVYNKELRKQQTFNFIELQQLVETFNFREEKNVQRAKILDKILDKIYRQVECETETDVKKMFNFRYQMRDHQGPKMNISECLAKVADLLVSMKETVYAL